MKHPFFKNTKTANHPRVFAHRGFAGTTDQPAAVENTRQAFKNALDLGVTFLETDCRATKDGEVVLFHDDTLTRITGENVHVKDLTRLELETRLESHGGLLTLADALTEFPEARFNVDVKTGSAANSAGKTAALHHERVLLTSFNDNVRLEALKAAGLGTKPATSPGEKTLKRILLSLLTGAKNRLQNELTKLDALQIPVRHGIVPIASKTLLRAAKNADVEVHVWTINDKPTMQKLLQMGVDGLVTDRADLALPLTRS